MFINYLIVATPHILKTQLIDSMFLHFILENVSMIKGSNESQGRTKWICPTPLVHSYIQGTKQLFYCKQSKINFSWQAQMAIRFTAIERGTAFLKELSYDDI